MARAMGDDGIAASQAGEAQAGPYGPQSRLAAFGWGAKAVLSVPGLMSFATFLGFGTLARDAGFTFGHAMLLTGGMFALPGQVVLVDQVVRHATLSAAIAAVMLTAVRFLPMTVYLLPQVLGGRRNPWVGLAAAHLVSATTMIESRRRLHAIPPATFSTLNEPLQAYHRTQDVEFMRFGEFRRKTGGSVPAILFTHDNYLGDYTGHGVDKADYLGHRVVLLVRDPADTAVSQYFQWRFRMRRGKKSLNAYPAHGAEVPIFDFVHDHPAGLAKVIEFLNEWSTELPRLRDLLVVRYEDMRASPEATLRRVLTFMGADPSEDELRQSVEFGSVENMRKLEQGKVFWMSGGRMTARDKTNPDAHKVRRAKVGGFRDYFDEAQLKQLDAMVEERMLPGFGYLAHERPEPPRAAASA